MKMTDSTIYVIRTRNKQDRLVWWVFDTKNRIVGQPKESKKTLLSRWMDKYGKPKEMVRYKGIARPAEAIATCCEIQNGTVAQSVRAANS